MKQRSYSKNKIYFIGAGPGALGLITVKGVEILRKAECVIYDYLVNKKLLKYVPKGAELINADTVRNTFSEGFTKQQDKLIQFIVEKAKKYKTVVRLKNGDPVMFGRLNEEIDVLIKNKIDFEIIPGVTAASSAAAKLKLGLTKTKVAPVVSFITGHKNPFNKDSSVEFKKLPKLGTLVFYMAVENISKITEKLITLGWNKNTYCGIVEKAGFSGEKRWIGKLKDIKKLSIAVKPPAVFFVGDVLKYAVEKK